MASDVTHSSTLRESWAQDVLDTADGGASYARIMIYTSGDALLCTITLQSPSFSRTGAVLTLLGVPLSGTASGTGTASYAKLVTSDSTDKIVQGTVDTADADFIIDNTSIVSGQTVRITACTYTATE